MIDVSAIVTQFAGRPVEQWTNSFFPKPMEQWTNSFFPKRGTTVSWIAMDRTTICHDNVPEIVFQKAMLLWP